MSTVWKIENNCFVITGQESNGQITFRVQYPDSLKFLISKVKRLFLQEIQSIESIENQPEIRIEKGQNLKYNQLEIKTDARNYIAIFINILGVVFNLGETTSEIYTNCNINPVYTKLSLLMALVDSGQPDAAIKTAVEYAKYPGYRDIQFEFAECLKDRGKYDLSSRVYASIDKDHPKFVNAHLDLPW